MSYPRNLHLVEQVNAPLAPLPSHLPMHATNGTFMYEADLIVPTTLAGFQFIAENRNLSKGHHVFLIGVNSDISMEGIMDAKQASRAERESVEDQQVRALKVAAPLALQHPKRDIIVTYYDEATPTELYRTLRHDLRCDTYTLHKWGYGTKPDAPKIEGSEYFDFTLGFPMPNDRNPVCYGITPVENQPQVNVFKLTENSGVRAAYLSQDGKILFPVNDHSLDRYTQKGFEEARAHAALLAVPKPEQP